MSETPKLDEVSFPGGYEITDIIVAVKLAEMTQIWPPVGGVPPGRSIRSFDCLFVGERAQA